MIAELPAGVEPRAIAPDEYEQFRRHVLALLHVDLNQYKREQLVRRLAGLRQRHGMRDLNEYAQRLRHDPVELERFRCWFTINVTEFFRDPDRWACLRDRVLPGLLVGRRSLRIWSAGCSFGAEAYSLAMLLEQFGAGGAHHILATDIDPAALAVARAGGPYGRNMLQNVGTTNLRRYFTREGEQWTVRPALRSQVTFWEADLTREPPERDFDLIVCRNVVIYFTETAKAQVLNRFDRALRPGGVLFTGATELIPRGNPYGFELEEPSFYRHP